MLSKRFPCSPHDDLYKNAPYKRFPCARRTMILSRCSPHLRLPTLGEGRRLCTGKAHARTTATSTCRSRSPFPTRNGGARAAETDPARFGLGSRSFSWPRGLVVTRIPFTIHPPRRLKHGSLEARSRRRRTRTPKRWVSQLTLDSQVLAHAIGKARPPDEHPTPRERLRKV
jgi:hypothetical protein